MRSWQFLMASFVLAAMLLVVGCGGEKGTGTTTGTTPATPTASKSSESPPVAGGEWLNVPLYPGSRETERYSVTLPSRETELKDIQYKFYESRDNVEKVAVFYETEMPKRGWDGAFMTSPSFAIGNYESSDESKMAVVTLSEDDGKTRIMLSVGTKR